MEKEYKEIKLKCVNDFEDYADVSIGKDGSVSLYAETSFTHVSIETTKVALKEFATNILKELDNDKEN